MIDEHGKWEPCADNPKVFRLVEPSPAWHDRRRRDAEEQALRDAERNKNRLRGLVLERLVAQELGEDTSLLDEKIKEAKKK